MSTSPDGSVPVLHVVACATLPVLRIGDLITLAQGRGWVTCLILTPSAARWLSGDLDVLAAQTGFPVRSVYKLPGEPDVHPAPSAILVAPASSNTINKWAAGISDTLALGLITEAIGKRIPMTAMPSLNPEQQAHPAFARSLATLQDAGVTVLMDHEGRELRGTGSGADAHATYPWDVGLDSLDHARPEGRS